MTTAEEASDDLSVRLEWPVDPLARDTPERHDEETDDAELVTRLASLEATIKEGAAAEAALHDLEARLDLVTKELVGVVKALNDTLQKTRDQTIGAVDRRVTALRKDIEAMVAANGDERAAFGQELAAELKAWRRRLPTKNPVGKVDAAAIEEMVTQVADEVEIRVAAALKKTGGKRR